MSEKIEYLQHAGSEWVLPVMKGYRMRCCDCGLTHSIDFEAGRILADGSFVPDDNLRVMFAVTRDEEETAKAREKKPKAYAAPTVKKPRHTPHKPEKPAPTVKKTRQTGDHLSAKDRNFCWGTVPEDD